jgi:magnesium-transporting ATPase (P-type)
LTAPADELAPHCPSFNLIGLEFMLIWWGNAIISSGGMAIASIYYKSTPDFVPNHNRSNLNGNTKLATITYLSIFLINLLVYISLISSRPFKKPLHTNKPAVLLLSILFCMITVFYFFTEHLGFLQLEPIGMQEAIVVYSIGLCTGSLCIAYSIIIRTA